MSTHSVARDALLNNWGGTRKLEAGSELAQRWLVEVGATLEAAVGGTGGMWRRVAMRQMSGIVAMVFAR
jgi:hypothetical protein